MMMTKDQIEQVVDLHMDSLNDRLARGDISPDTYSEEVRQLNSWAEQQR